MFMIIIVIYLFHVYYTLQKFSRTIILYELFFSLLAKFGDFDGDGKLKNKNYDYYHLVV